MTIDDPFRYCVYCGTDCFGADPLVDGPPEYDPDAEHAGDCPSVTGLYPVTEQFLGMRGPDDPYALGARCMDCGDEFKVGDVYAHRQVSEDVREVVCVGCRILNPESPAEDVA